MARDRFSPTITLNCSISRFFISFIKYSNIFEATPCPWTSFLEAITKSSASGKSFSFRFEYFKVSNIFFMVTKLKNLGRRILIAEKV